MLMIEYKDISWWYWLVTACLLSTGLAGYPIGFILAISLTVVQIIHFTLRDHSVMAFPVQVRFWYLVLLLVALPGPLQLIFGYCTMARCVSLLPWNRQERFSVNLLMRTFLSRPVRGNILQGLPQVR